MKKEATPLKITAILTVHNRRDLTLKCLHGLSGETTAGVDLDIVLVDDGSTDGTAAAIAEAFPWVKVLHGDGSLFWCGGMRVAEQDALTNSPDLILWLNDDIDLEVGGIARLLETWRETDQPTRTIVAGALCDPATGEVTYSGYSRVASAIFRLQRKKPTKEPQKIDAFNGNLVLIPFEVAKRLGGISERFSHHYADFDYGLRARQLGFEVLLAPGFFGQTARNSAEGTFRDPNVVRKKRFNALVGKKGFPPFERLHYLATHGTTIWPIQWLGFYAYWALRILARR